MNYTIPNELCIWRKTFCTASSVLERGELQCGDQGQRIILCEINSFKTDNIDGYIINLVIRQSGHYHLTNQRVI